MNWRRYIGWAFLGSFGLMILWVIASFVEVLIPIDEDLVIPEIRGEGFSVQSHVSPDGPLLFVRTEKEYVPFVIREGVLRCPQFESRVMKKRIGQINASVIPPHYMLANEFPDTRRKLSRLVEQEIKSGRSKSPVAAKWDDVLYLPNHPLVRTRFYMRMVFDNLIDIH